MHHISLLAAMPDTKLFQGLRDQIEQQDEVELVGETHGTRQTLHHVRQVRPDVLLLDATSSNSDGRWLDSKLLAAVHRSSPGTKVILLVDACTERSIARALEQGARGCITTAASPDGCLSAIRAVSRGEVWIGRKALASVLDDLLKRLERAESTTEKSAAVLSDRELEIADAVRLGLTNKEIARKMRISPTTVKTHLEHIFHKLHVSHRVQLAILTPAPAARYPSARLKDRDALATTA